MPFFDEEDGITHLVRELNQLVRANDAQKFEIIYVDDGSDDDSVKYLLAAKHEYFFRLIKLSRNFGSHAALRAGIQHATSDLITFLYADLQDPPQLTVQLAAKMAQGHDIVWANRTTTSSGVFSRLFSRTYAALMRRFVSPRFPLLGYDIVMFNQKVRQELIHAPELNSSIFLQILDFGFRQSTISYDRQNRLAGQSKWTIAKKIKLLVDSFVAFSFAPIRFVTYTGILFSLSGFLYLVIILVRSLVFDNLAEGWGALVSILMIGFGITNVSLGVIAEYLWRTFDAARGRKVFIVDDVIECNDDLR